MAVAVFVVVITSPVDDDIDYLDIRLKGARKVL